MRALYSKKKKKKNINNVLYSNNYSTEQNMYVALKMSNRKTTL